MHAGHTNTNTHTHTHTLTHTHTHIYIYKHIIIQTNKSTCFFLNTGYLNVALKKHVISTTKIEEGENEAL